MRVVGVVLSCLCVAASTGQAASAPRARSIVAHLQRSGLPIVHFKAYTAANDPNHLLGRPNGYKSKVNFVDRRVAHSSSDPFDTSNGGSVEVWQTHGDAKRRAAYLQSGPCARKRVHLG